MKIIVFHDFQNICTGRRTIFHDTVGDYTIGDEISLSGHANSPRGLVATVGDVRNARLEDLDEVDETKLCCTKDAYIARWRALHPEQTGESDVFRIEFRYGFASSRVP